MNTRGFTLVELVMTIALVGILAVVALPRMFNTSAFEGQGFFDQTVSVLHYAQKAAIAQRRTVCVAFEANKISLRIASTFGSNTCDIDLEGPDGTPGFTITARRGIHYLPVPNNFQYTARGAASVSQSIGVTGVPKTINIDANTGHAYVL